MKTAKIYTEFNTGARFNIDTKLDSIKTVKTKSNKLEDLKQLNFILKK